MDRKKYEIIFSSYEHICKKEGLSHINVVTYAELCIKIANMNNVQHGIYIEALSVYLFLFHKKE